MELAICITGIKHGNGGFNWKKTTSINGGCFIAMFDYRRSFHNPIPVRLRVDGMNVMFQEHPLSQKLMVYCNCYNAICITVHHPFPHWFGCHQSFLSRLVGCLPQHPGRSWLHRHFVQKKFGRSILVWKWGTPKSSSSSWFIMVHHILSYSNCHVAVISHFRIGHDRPAWQEADVAWDLRLTPWSFVLGDFPLDAIRIEMSQAWWEVLFLPTTNSFFELREFTTVIVMNSLEMGYDREPPNITWQKQWKTPQNNPDTVSGSAEIGAILGFFHGWDYEANFSYGA